jgi:RNA polymerase sigma-70 factor (ECF subfamily)
MHTKDPQGAFTDIYNTEADALFRFCASRVSDREQALDLAQETFTRLWKSMNEGAEIEYPRTFLYTIARNCIIDWYRKKKSLSLEAMSNPETDEPYEPVADDAETDLGLKNEGRFLLSKINELSAGHRDAVYLRFVEGLSPPEIGKIIGISANAASVRITRGIEELRKLTGYEIDESSN